VPARRLRKSQAGASGDWFEKVSGSMGITGACDAVMVLSGKRGEETTTLNVTGRDFDPVEMVLSFRDGFRQLRSTDSEAWRKEQECLQSPAVRGVIMFMKARERWEGSAANLLEELCEIQGIDMKPEALGKELHKFREPLYNQDHIFFQWRKSNGRRLLTLSRDKEGSLVI